MGIMNQLITGGPTLHESFTTQSEVLEAWGILKSPWLFLRHGQPRLNSPEQRQASMQQIYSFHFETYHPQHQLAINGHSLVCSPNWPCHEQEDEIHGIPWEVQPPRPDSPGERWPLRTVTFAGCLWISFRSHLYVFTQLPTPKEHHGTSGFVWNSVINMRFNICEQRRTLFRSKTNSYDPGSRDQRWSSRFPGQGSSDMSYTWGFV